MSKTNAKSPMVGIPLNRTNRTITACSWWKLSLSGRGLSQKRSHFKDTSGWSRLTRAPIISLIHVVLHIPTIEYYVDTIGDHNQPQVTWTAVSAHRTSHSQLLQLLDEAFQSCFATAVSPSSAHPTQHLCMVHCPLVSSSSRVLCYVRQQRWGGRPSSRPSTCPTKSH